MAVNHLPTHVAADRGLSKVFQLNASKLLISFADGSKMTVTIAECNSLTVMAFPERQISEDRSNAITVVLKKSSEEATHSFIRDTRLDRSCPEC